MLLFLLQDGRFIPFLAWAFFRGCPKMTQVVTLRHNLAGKRVRKRSLAGSRW